MREKVARLMTLSWMGMLFLVAVADSNSLTVVDQSHNQQTLQDTSTLRGSPAEPIGSPGSGKGQGPVPVSSPSLLSADTSSAC